VVPQERVDKLYADMMAQENIVLIGMPGSGKSTVGQRLADTMGRPLVDTDTLIVEKSGKTIPDLFAEVGEKGFRNLESAVIGEISTRKGCVIATGGGAVLRPENMERLRENGRIYFLDRSFSLLTATADRPLTSTMADLQKRYEERYSLYCAACDMKIAADSVVEDVANQIREDFLYEHFGD
jgi:shikimate dehydrogenase